jgi:hypothetical protein
MVAIKSSTQLSEFRTSGVSNSQQLHWTAQTSGQNPAKSESAGNMIWIGHGTTSSGVASDTQARRQAWRELWAMLDEVDQQSGLYDHMTDEWLSEMRDGWDNRLDELYGTDYRD